MKMSIIASLAKAKLDTENIEGSNLVAVRHTIDHLSRQWLYPLAVYEHSAQSALQNMGCRHKKKEEEEEEEYC